MSGAGVRTVFTGGLVFDGTGAEPAPADVVVADGRIVDVGTGLDGDTQVDCTGRTQFFEAAVNLRRTLEAGITTIRDAANLDELPLMERCGMPRARCWPRPRLRQPAYWGTTTWASSNRAAEPTWC